MSIMVRQFDEKGIIEDLIKSGKNDAVKLIGEYRLLLKNQEHITQEAIKKMREMLKKSKEK